MKRKRPIKWSADRLSVFWHFQLKSSGTITNRLFFYYFFLFSMYSTSNVLPIRLIVPLQNCYFGLCFRWLSLNHTSRKLRRIYWTINKKIQSLSIAVVKLLKSDKNSFTSVIFVKVLLAFTHYEIALLSNWPAVKFFSMMSVCCLQTRL